MTIALLGQAVSNHGGCASGAPRNVSVAMGVSVPVGSVVTVLGSVTACSDTQSVVSVTDGKSNTWALRVADPMPHAFLADSRITTALDAADTIAVTLSGDDGTATWGFCVAAWSGMHWSDYYHLMQRNSWNNRNVIPGVQAVADTPGELVLGLFGMNGAGTGATTPTILTPGSGYTNQIGNGCNFSMESVCSGFDWESKIGAAAGAEQPDATLNVTVVKTYGMTALYRPDTYLPNPMLGVV